MPSRQQGGIRPQAGLTSCLETRWELAQNTAMDPVNKRLDMFLRKQPTLGKGVYIAQGATVLGDVTLGDCSSVWCNTVLRGDINRIVVGHHTNIQDNAVLHLADEMPCLAGQLRHRGSCRHCSCVHHWRPGAGWHGVGHPRRRGDRRAITRRRGRPGHPRHADSPRLSGAGGAGKSGARIDSARTGWT